MGFVTRLEGFLELVASIYFVCCLKIISNNIWQFLDTQAPALTNCSDDIVAFTDLNSNGTRVSWDDPVVMENDVYTISQTLAPGYFFSVGNMTVTYYVEDRSGLNDTCEFLVKVFGKQ